MYMQFYPYPKILALVLCSFTLLHADLSDVSLSEEGGTAAVLEEQVEPWFTGPLIAPLGQVVPLGELEIDNYVYFTITTAAYDGKGKAIEAPNFYTLNPTILGYFGLTPWMDLQINPQFYYTETQGKSCSGWGDLGVGLDFQLYNAEEKFWFPGIKFTVKEVFPTGKYDRLNPAKLTTDALGLGAFTTSFNLLLYKIYQWAETHFLSVTLSAEYLISSPVNVQGFNAYGGGFDTKGKVLPGNTFTGICSFECNLTQNWALALDSVWTQSDSTYFYGDLGVTETGDPASVGGGSSYQFSLAPAIEYNFGPQLGIISGCWLTIFGRQADKFYSSVTNLYYYF